MSRQAVMFGAGNIGRGFIGQLFSESGCEVVFVDVDEELIATLNREGSYHLQTVFNDEVDDFRIGPVRAVNGADAEAAADVVAQADVGATAVGAGALKYVAPTLARGIARRSRDNAPPLNIIVCENLKGAAAHLRTLVRESIAPEAVAYLADSVGFVDTVIGRMVPMPTPEMRARDVSFIRVEPYKELPVDQAGFVGEIPEISAMEAHDNFPLYTARKLYIHNCGHALLAYIGYLRGHEFGYEAMKDSVVREGLDKGLRESLGGIVAEYGADRAWLEEHVDDLMRRFSNTVLADTIFRLGRDPLRKLAPSDRLVGAAVLAMKTGVVPVHLARGIAAAFRFDPSEDPAAQQLQELVADKGAAVALTEVTGIEASSMLGKAVLGALRS